MLTVWSHFLKLVSSPSFDLTHIVPFLEVIYYLSLHLSHIHHHFPHDHYNYHQRLQIKYYPH
ncbi:hypothetical protein BpHYR1_002391 [Brachionus plicatilis]|uniref:Uncharacterized protein n=1 Tax=Brachionus plicatilis TaxID=10195 RepID=A0A3M7QFW5_BRAPC|nr:hypothetical protein BpHYR1_002391 [Brachionus plicatilis]